MAGNLLLSLPGFVCRKCHNYVAKRDNIVRAENRWIIFSKCLNVKEAVGDDHKWFDKDNASCVLFVYSRSDAVSLLCCSCSEAIGWRFVEVFQEDIAVKKDNVLLIKAKIFSNEADSDLDGSIVMLKPGDSSTVNTANAAIVTGSSILTAEGSDVEKKVHRVPVQRTEEEKRYSRAVRFGTASGTCFSSTSRPGASKSVEEMKRFGEGKKKARDAEFAPAVAKTDPNDHRKTLRANNTGDIEPLFTKLEMGNPGQPSTVGTPGQLSGNLNKALGPPYFQTPSTTVESPKETDGLKTTIDGMVRASSVTPAAVSDIEKRMSRAKRFGISPNLTEKEKRDYRAIRFGTASSTISSSASGSEALKKLELKRKARAERFGMASEEEAKKKARLAAAKTDPHDKRRKSG